MLFYIGDFLKNFYFILEHRICLQCGRPGFDPWLGRSPGEGNGSPVQYSGLENSMDRGAWQARVHGVTELNLTEQFSLSFSFLFFHFHFQLINNVVFSFRYTAQ